MWIKIAQNVKYNGTDQSVQRQIKTINLS